MSDTYDHEPSLPWELDPEEATGLPEEPMAELTKEQQAFLDAVADAEPGALIALTGEGGAGKTYVLARMASAHLARMAVKEEEEAVPRLGRDQAPLVVFACPTHQARNVLKDELEAAGCDAQVTTVASLLKKAPDRSRPPTGDVLRQTFISNGGDPLPPGTILVLDEVSMDSVADVAALRALNKAGVTVLSGDPAQLPPVEGESIWQALAKTEAAGKATHYHLTQNLRARSPDLVSYINEIRRTGALPAHAPAEVVTIYRNRRQFHEALLVCLNEGGPSRVAALAYRNDTVNRTADVVRAAYGYRPGYAVDGEVLRVNGAMSVLDWRTEYERLKYEEGMSQEDAFRQASENVRDRQIQTGDLMVVLKAGEPKPYSVAWAPGQAMQQVCLVRMLTGAFEGEERRLPLARLGNPQDVKDLLEACRLTIKQAVDGVANQYTSEIDRDFRTGHLPPAGKLWGEYFYKVQDKFCLAQNAASMTIHKAQGSGRDHVFVDWVDLAGDEADQLRYTACSRARQHLHILVGGAP